LPIKQQKKPITTWLNLKYWNPTPGSCNYFKLFKTCPISTREHL